MKENIEKFISMKNWKLMKRRVVVRTRSFIILPHNWQNQSMSIEREGIKLWSYGHFLPAAAVVSTWQHEEHEQQEEDEKFNDFCSSDHAVCVGKHFPSILLHFPERICKQFNLRVNENLNTRKEWFCCSGFSQAQMDRWTPAVRGLQFYPTSFLSLRED